MEKFSKPYSNGRKCDYTLYAIEAKKDGTYGEKGIDVWLALEAYELAIYKRFDILALVTGDGDYVPLVRKLNTLGTHVMLPYWDFTYNDDGEEKVTRTSQQLLEEVTYPIAMHNIIDDRVKRKEPIVNGLFCQKPFSQATVKEDEVFHSYILSIKDGFGFIREKPDNVYFYHSSLENKDFNELKEGMKIKYTKKMYKGKLQASKVWVED